MRRAHLSADGTVLALRLSTPHMWCRRRPRRHLDQYQDRPRGPL